MTWDFTQGYGIDYEETFALVAKMTIVHTLLAITSVHQWRLFQLDVKNIFLHGDLFEEVYMQPPPDLSTLPLHVYRLCKAIYGLKQAPRAWFERSVKLFLILIFRYALYVRASPLGLTILLFYVDDMIITRDDAAVVASLMHRLHYLFKMADLGPLQYFIGLEVAHSS